MKNAATKYQQTTWFDTEKHAAIHGIQIWHEYTWKNLAENGKPLLYKDESKREEKLKALRLEARRLKKKSLENVKAHRIPD